MLEAIAKNGGGVRVLGLANIVDLECGYAEEETRKLWVERSSRHR